MSIGIGVLIICFSFMGTIWLSIKAADFHYKIKDTDAPLYFIYAVIFVSIWGAIMAEIFNGL